jgi:FdhE protein
MSASSQLSKIPVRSSSEPPTVIAPDALTLFSRRAARFEQLAEGHALGDWLRFLAALSRAQQEALRDFPQVPLPDRQAIAAARQHAMPPLPAQSWARDPAWREALAKLLDAVMPQAPEPARAAFAALRALPAADLESLADRVLRTEFDAEHAVQMPLVGAALQVMWTAAAARLGEAGLLAPLDVPGVCPCCGFLPVASIVQSVGEGDARVANLRYLHCALCNTGWNLVRVKCAACDATEGIAYRLLEGEGLRKPEAVRAETCDSCKSYLKIVYAEVDTVDPVADDLATLALDMLVDEAGYARAGPNLLLIPGSG